MAITHGIPTYEPSRASIYTAMRFRWRFPDMAQDGSALNSTTNIPTSVTYTVTDDHGAALSPANTGSLTYNSTDETWDGQVTAPSTAGRYHIHMAVAKGSDVTFFHDTFLTLART